MGPCGCRVVWLGSRLDAFSSSLEVLLSAKNWLVKVRTPPLFYTLLLKTSIIALRLACDKLPTSMEFIDRKAPPRLGNLLIAPEMIADAHPSDSVESTL